MATSPSVNSAEPIVCRPSILEPSRDEPPSSLTRRREEGLPLPLPTLEPWVADGRLPQPTLGCERDPRRVPYLAVGLDAFSPILFAVDLAHGPTRGQFRLRCPVAYLPKHLGAWYGSRSKPRLKRNSPSRATRPRGRASTVLCPPAPRTRRGFSGLPSRASHLQGRWIRAGAGAPA